MLGLASAGLVASLSGTPQLPVDETQVAIEWEAPSGCPSREDVERDLARLRAEAAAASGIQIVARVHAVGEGFRVELTTAAGDRAQARSLFSTRCDTLARAVALIAAVDIGVVGPSESTTLTRADAVDLLDVPAPQLPARPSEQSASVAPPPDPTPPDSAPLPSAAPRPTNPPPPPKRRPGRDWTHRAVLSAGAGPSLGVTPSVTAVLGGRIGWRFDEIQLDAAAFHHFSSERTVVGDAAIAGQLTGAGLRGCYVFTRGPLEFPVCGGVALGSLRTEPNGAVTPRVVNRGLWAGASADAAIAWPIRPRFALVLGAQLGVALRRPAVHWTVSGERQLAFRTAPATFSATLGPEIRLP